VRGAKKGGTNFCQQARSPVVGNFPDSRGEDVLSRNNSIGRRNPASLFGLVDSLLGEKPNTKPQGLKKVEEREIP